MFFSKQLRLDQLLRDKKGNINDKLRQDWASSTPECYTKEHERVLLGHDDSLNVYRCDSWGMRQVAQTGILGVLVSVCASEPSAQVLSGWPTVAPCSPPESCTSIVNRMVSYKDNTMVVFPTNNKLCTVLRA